MAMSAAAAAAVSLNGNHNETADTTAAAAASAAAALTTAADTGTVADSTAGAGTTGAGIIDAPSTLPAAAAGGIPPTGAGEGESPNHGVANKPAVTMLVPCRTLVTSPLGVSLSLSHSGKDKDREGEEGRRVPFRARKKPPVRGVNPARLLPPIGAAAGVVAVSEGVGEGVRGSDDDTDGVIVITENKSDIAHAEGSSTTDGNAIDNDTTTDARLTEEESQMATFPLRQKAVPSHPSVPPSSTILAMDG